MNVKNNLDKGYIEFENEFRSFMGKEGPWEEKAQGNYISWLRFIAKNGFNIGKDLKENDTIIDFLKEDEPNRDIYKGNKNNDYSNFKSALNKYRKFISAKTSLSDDIKIIKEDRTLADTEKELLISARVGQGKYRQNLIELWGKCAVSGCKRIELLIASHIKPWSKSSDREKLDLYNGLLLLPNYDKLFDKGLISFEDDGRIIISPLIEKEEYKILGINPDDKLFNLYPENKPYLEEHRRTVYYKE